MERFANNADSTLNGVIDSSTTTIVVADGTPFPSSGDFRLIFGTNPDTCEIVLATARTGNTLTVIRGQENTAAQSWADGSIVTHIVTAGAVEALRDTLKGKSLHSSLETVGTSQDGYALTWINSDGYWAARPGSPFNVLGNELVTTKTLSIDENGTVASDHGDGNSKLYVNGSTTAEKYNAGAIVSETAKFGYVSDALQSFIVPDGVTALRVKMWGPGGGTGNYSGSGGGGPGGYSAGILSVTPGETLYLAVGSGGKKAVSSSGNGGLGGWPGGGFGTRGDASGGGGGGLTGIFNTSMSQANALMIAGGGGGSTGYGNFGAGGGGGLTGGGGVIGTSGFGGTQSAGGNNSNNTATPSYTAGSALAGGTAYSDNTTSQGNDCGGGGSGYWGGGAGQGDGRAGGGGSGFLHATRVSGGVTTTGSNANIGSSTTLPPNTSDPDYIAGIGVGAAATGVGGTDGGDGYIILSWGGITTLDSDSLDFANGSTISGPTTNANITITPANGGSVVLEAPTNGLITLQSASDILLSSDTDIKFNISSAQKFKIYSSGAIVIGDAANNDTSSEAQAGLTGAVINMAAITGGSPTSTTNQALVFNNAGFGTIQGHSGVTFRVNTGIAGFFDSNNILRLGPSSNSSATLQGATVPFAGADYLYMYNSSGSTWAEIVAGGSVHRAALQVLSNATSNTCGVSLFAGAPSHATAEYAGNGIIEQSGNSTSALVFTKKNGTDGLSFASTGAIWQSGAWTIGRVSNNDTSSEAQAGLTGPLLNLTTISGGTLTSVTNQGLLYNNNGTITLQGHVGHSFIANTTTIASINSSKFITNQGRRVKTTITTTNLTITVNDEVIIVGALSGPITITLPSSPTAGDIYTVKDQGGTFAVHNVVVNGNGNNIDGAASYVMNTNYQSINVLFANGSWSII